jgi:multiple antibiotic resistance protein
VLIDVFLPAFATLFVAVDPVGLIPLFISLTVGQDPAARRLTALRASGIALVVLLAFALFGEKLLGAIGITLPAFRVAGGVLLFVIAFEMLFERRKERRERTAAAYQDSQDDVSVFPLAIPLICGPGAIASTLLLMAEGRDDLGRQVAVLGAVVASVVLALLAFLAASWIARHVSPTLNTIVTRLLGMLLAALATQFIFDGLKAGLLAPAVAGG